MSDLSELAASPVSVAGKILAKPSLEDYGMVEEEFGRQHEANATIAAYRTDMPQPARDHLIRTATSDVASGIFNWGRKEFTLKLLSVKALPLLLWLCARHEDPKLTIESAASLIDEKNESEVQEKVLKLWGFDSTKKAKAGEAPPSSGDSSSKSSAENDA